jgi:hypothetical protein
MVRVQHFKRCCVLLILLSLQDIGKQAAGDSFVTEWFSNWKKKEKIEGHVGGSQ